MILRRILLRGLPRRAHTVQQLHRSSTLVQSIPPNSGTSNGTSLFLDSFSLTYLQIWTGTFFRKCDLQSAGQHVQHGHPPGKTCTSPQQSTRPFAVIHTNGIHLVDILFCGCDLAADHRDRIQQLLWRCIFPATTTDPQSGSTFALLELAQVLSVQSKLSLYDFYISIDTLTDATRVSNVKVCVQHHHQSLPLPSNVLQRIDTKSFSGYWSDAMDNKFGHWNWTKLLRLGMSPYFLLREGEHSFLMLMKVRSLQRSTWTPLARKSSTQKNCCLSTQDCHQVSFSHGKRRSQLGRKIGAPQILTTYLK